jgi:hypothetical protein
MGEIPASLPVQSVEGIGDRASFAPQESAVCDFQSDYRLDHVSPRLIVPRRQGFRDSEFRSNLAPSGESELIQLRFMGWVLIPLKADSMRSIVSIKHFFRRRVVRFNSMIHHSRRIAIRDSNGIQAFNSHFPGRGAIAAIALTPIASKRAIASFLNWLSVSSTFRLLFSFSSIESPEVHGQASPSLYKECHMTIASASNRRSSESIAFSWELAFTRRHASSHPLSSIPA